MYGINIYALVGISFVALLLFIAFIYYTKRKYDSIDEYNRHVSNKSNSYKDNKKHYEKNLEDSGVKSHNTKKNILNFIKLFRGSS